MRSAAFPRQVGDPITLPWDSRRVNQGLGSVLRGGVAGIDHSPVIEEKAR